MRPTLIYYNLVKVSILSNLNICISRKTNIGLVTPGISAQEYHDRRSAFARLLPKDTLAVIPGASIKSRSGPVFYDFHQDPDFLYLTGWLEPDAVAVLSAWVQVADVLREGGRG